MYMYSRWALISVQVNEIRLFIQMKILPYPLLITIKQKIYNVIDARKLEFSDVS